MKATKYVTVLILILVIGLLASYTGKATNTIIGSSTLPTICDVGTVAFKIDAIAGSNIFGCTAINTWTLQSGATTNYGQIYIDATPGPTLTLTTAGTFYPIITYTAVSLQNGVTGNAAAGTITVNNAGIYSLAFSASYTSSNMEIYHMSVFVGSVQNNHISMESKSANNTDVANINSTGIISLAAGDVISLRASAENNNRTITTNHVSLVLHGM